MSAAFCCSAPLLQTRNRPATRASYICCERVAEQISGKTQTRLRADENKSIKGNRFISEVSNGDELIGVVKFVGPAKSSWVDIGVCTKNGKNVMGRLRFPRGRRGTNEGERVGSIIPVYVQRVQPDSGRIEVKKRSHPASEKIVPDNPLMIHDVQIGDKFNGKVCAVGPYGAVVDTNVFRIARHGRIVSRTGLLPRKFFKEDWATEADLVTSASVCRTLKVGEDVTVWVRKVNAENALLLFDANIVTREDVQNERNVFLRQLRKRRKRLQVSTLKMGERRIGIVTNIAEYGLFANIGVKKDGLIHASRIPERHKRNWKDFEIGEEVCVEVTDIVENGIALTLIGAADDILREALQKANSATARFADVERAQEILDLMKNPRPKTRKTEEEKTEPIEIEAQTSSDEGVQEEEEEENSEGTDSENVQKFSDEYFEDKYGF
ncbi:unnamed protein product [Agarophyton chilense]